MVLAIYRYRAQGERDAVLHGNGTQTRYGYDAMGRLATLSTDLAGTASGTPLHFESGNLLRSTAGLNLAALGRGARAGRLSRLRLPRRPSITY
ncbi:MAG TPA: hypothetical protein VF702_13435 [Allosphingosinicella sp.]|jgi:YD repeat-containing protein